jgi:hypothetical protein
MQFPECLDNHDDDRDDKLLANTLNPLLLFGGLRGSILNITE